MGGGEPTDFGETNSKTSILCLFIPLVSVPLFFFGGGRGPYKKTKPNFEKSPSNLQLHS